MQLLLSFVETTPVDGAAPAWETLGDAERAEIVTILARLIAKAVQAEIAAIAGTEVRDE